MASSCSHLVRQISKTSRLFNKSLKEPWHWRYFGLSPAVCQEPAAAVSGSEGEIVIPRKKTWSKEAVLQALAATVNRDPTACHYMFQDDSYLTPRTSGEFKLYSLSQESGRNAAKYFINTYPRYFQKDFAEPHIPCLMPETVELQIEEVSEAALVERIRLRKVKAAVDMYDQLVQAGSPVSLDLTNDLLDLICVYGDQDPAREDSPEQRTDDAGEEQEDSKRRKGRPRRASELLTIVWRENNNAQRIFNTMPERNSRSYGALIRGMVKYGAYSKAFDMYTDLLNNRLTADMHTFNALIIAAAEVRDKYSDKWDLVIDLLKQMAQQKVKPNLITFNTVLKVLRRCGSLAKAQAFLILNEMKALGIGPSLATYDHILGIFYKAASSSQGHTEILQEVLNEMSGKSFTAQDPDDDLEKAYDRVPREELWYCMRKSGVAAKYVRVVQDMYERSRTVVRCAVGQTEEFNVEVGLHQGSALSPFLFAIVMDQLSEEVRQESPWTMMFADDIVICSESREQMEENLERWRFALERRGMKVSRSKTEYMCVNEREGSGTVRLQGEEVKKVQEFKYLGSTVQSNGECGKEVKKRVQAVQFFPNVMRICLDNKDIEQAYRVHSLLEVKDNWQLLGDSYHQSIYYGRFFNLLCMMEHIDVVLKWYREFIPSLYYPNSHGIKDLLQALDMDNRLDLLPQIWKDIKRMGHDNRLDLLEQILSLMAREKQSAEVQHSFADCALDIKRLFMQSDHGRVPLNWSTNSLSSITAILLAAERIQEAGEILNIFKATNRIPSEDLMNEFFACIKAHNDAQQAVELVQLSASFCLPVTPHLIERVQQEFELTDEQKVMLSDLESSTYE
ncbi:hypothetical protein QTP70_016844 [Hemibagrus guttatus]|uniref:Small ribosomal subunit protein mS39 n=1 Tax=Hemibagrus guttatus TaxID=175788 RepID=A0AAE0QYQ1_9TELE|nr:hypothetical protein QTP70_016844 [Hemibagrus guttatus]